MRRMKTYGAVMVGSAVLLGALTGCGSSAPTQDPVAETSASTTVTTLTDENLGKAVVRLAFSGFASDKMDPLCFAEAAKDAGLNTETQTFLVGLNGNDWKTAGERVISGVKKDGAAQSKILLGKEFQALVNKCVDTGYKGEKLAPSVQDSEETEAAKAGEADAKDGDAATGATATAEPAKANTTAKYVIKKEEQIATPDQIEPGLVSMLSSFGDEEADQMIEEGSNCIANAVTAAGFSQEALHFLAGGAPLGAGSIADQLPDADATLWNTEGFVTKLSACMYGG